MTHKILFGIVLLFSFSWFLAAQSVPLPLDPQINYGKLDNGLTYYIRKNEQPQQRAEFYLVQRTGSLQEEENQRGLAHVLEHMAFNGSTHFPGEEVDRYLESIGLKSGENLNAYTAFDETVFMIMNAPVLREGIVDSCLLILRDISSGLLLEDVEIEKERAVIREEWRSGQDANARLTEQQFPVLLAGSKYAERLPIGRIHVIETFTPDDLRAYYQKWYRPDLQAVVVVGDVDTVYVRKQIEALFGEILPLVDPVEREKELVPDQPSPAVVIAKDKEAPGYIVNLFFPYEKLADSLYASVEGIRTDYLQTVVSSLLNERLDEKLYVSDPPFVFAQSSIGDYMGTQTKSAWSIAAIAEEGKADSTLSVLVKEAERVNRFGFTFSEYERMKVNVLKYYESLYLERDNEENATYAESFVAHFTNGGYLPAIETEYDLVSRIAEETTVEDINSFAHAILQRRNQAIISLTGPDKKDPDIYPEKSALLDIFQGIADKELLPYQENDSLPPLLAVIPAPGEIVKEEVDTLFHAVHLTLGNGVQVVAKQTSFKEDEIIVSGTSPGGSTLFDKKDSHNLKVFSDVVSLGGLGEHSATEIRRILAGKNVSCSISLDENSESVGGYTSVSDLRTLFELIYLHFARPKEDDDAFSSYCTRLSAQLKNLDLNPMVAFGDSLTAALYGNNTSVMRITEEEIKRLDYKRILAMYEERFSDASDFVFTIVGSFQLDTVRALAKEYLATLPVLHRIEQGNEQALVPYREGAFHNVFRKKMEIPKASIVHYYHGNTEYSLKNILSANILTQLLDLVYMEKVRKKEGGSYGVSSLARLFAFPKGRATLQIFYDTDPSKWLQIDSIVQSELHQLIVQAPGNEDLAIIKKNLIKTHEENRTNNIYWLSVIDNYYFSSFDSHSTYLQTLERITAKDISDLVREIQSQNNFIEIVLLPEE